MRTQFSTNNGLVFETAAHWISSYFLGDPFLRMPASAEEAFESTEREAAYLRRRHPDTLLWVNESYNGLVKFFTYVSSPPSLPLSLLFPFVVILDLAEENA